MRFLKIVIICWTHTILCPSNIARFRRCCNQWPFITLVAELEPQWCIRSIENILYQPSSWLATASDRFPVILSPFATDDKYFEILKWCTSDLLHMLLSFSWGWRIRQERSLVYRCHKYTVIFAHDTAQKNLNWWPTCQLIPYRCYMTRIHAI